MTGSPSSAEIDNKPEWLGEQPRPDDPRPDDPRPDEPRPDEHRPDELKKIHAAWKRFPAERMFGLESAGGGVYRWGWATATDSPVDFVTDQLSRLATTNLGDTLEPPVHRQEAISWPLAAEDYLQTHRNESTSTIAAMRSVHWGAAMPMLASELPETLWWRLLDSLLLRWAGCDDDPDTAAASRLIGAAELGLTLVWRLGAVPSCARLKTNSLLSLQQFFEGEDVSIDEVLGHPRQLRMVLGSMLRCERLLHAATKRKYKKDDRDFAFDVASWTAALTRHDGTAAWSSLSAEHVADDVRVPPASKTKKAKAARASARPIGGLLGAATHFDEESLRPAIAASLGESQSGGRLAWEITLPESMWHAESAGQAVMMPEWDVRRGRTFVDYSGDDVRIEIMGGRCLVFEGKIETTVRVGGADQSPTGKWQNSCEFTDDDVHYLELEQSYSGDVVLQRQVMVIRDDRCVMIADAVLPTEKLAQSPEADTMPIQILTRLPLAAGVRADADPEIREVSLSTNKPRALAMPLAAGEWRVGSTDSTLEPSEDGFLVLQTRGRGTIYSPLWLDFQARRFRRKRTWRSLTVADQLSIVPRHEAVGFRVQVGSEHWIVYRSMRGVLPRSFLGRHLSADFFAARFHPGDGGMEELVTVENAED